ncbi:MAG: TrkA C-terminal domain-containing protein, partial [Lachnospiraceae bacterium]|nr:TrkA C-terminal domain-containing protein [Lachnospiraceae bacterium]
KLDGSHAIFEVTVPDGWVGRTIGNIDIRKKYGISILAIKRDGKMSLIITPDTQLDSDMTMLVLGDQKAIQKCFKI